MFFKLLFLVFVAANVQSISGKLSDLNHDINSILLKAVSSDSEKKNVAWSPYSIVVGLGMLYEGMGDGSRAKASLEGGFPESYDKFVEEFKTVGLLKSISKVQDNFVVIDESKGAKFSYAEGLNATLNAGVFRGNLTTDTEKSITYINKRVNKKTFGKISKFLTPDNIPSTTAMILINVLYFNATWRKEFEKKVQSGVFLLGNDESNKVDTSFMFGEISGGYLKAADGTEVISVPFEDDNYEMVFVVPKTDLKTFIDKETATPNILRKVTNPGELEKKVLALWVPKFSVKSNLPLKEDLSQSPKLKEFFSPTVDYSRMAESKVEVNEVHQTVVMDVTTGGVEAAATTGIVVTLYSAFVPDHEVRVNRPFLHFIVEKSTNMILFGGYVQDPRDDGQ